MPTRPIGFDRRRQAAISYKPYSANFQRRSPTSPLNQMLFPDAKVWLPDDLLNKADR